MWQRSWRQILAYKYVMFDRTKIATCSKMSWTLVPQLLNGPRYSDKAIFPSSILADIVARLEEDLPHPLIFRLHCEDELFYIGVIEFSAEENVIKLPELIFNKIRLETAIAELVTDIPKGTQLSLKPLQFYPQILNWKFFLESRLPKLYTTLTKHEKLLVEDDKGIYELFVENLNANTVCITDTEMALDIVPLDDVMAQQQLEFSKTIKYLDEYTTIEFNKPITVDIEAFNSPNFKTQLFQLKVNPQRPKFYIVLESTQASNADIVVGTDKFVGMDSFSWSTMEVPDDADKKIIEIDATNVKAELLHIAPFAWEFSCSITISVVFDIQEPQAGPDTIACSNCGKHITKGKIQLHEAYCFRHNIKCSCGVVFSEKIASGHWHCDKCNGHGNSTMSRAKHDKLFHLAPYKCDKCGHGSYDNFCDLVRHHKAVDCPEKLHECQFCHMIVPQEESTYQDRYLGLTHHENWCGNKTVECFKCSKVLRSKDMANHLHLHELDKMEMNNATRMTFVKCSNVNCVNVSDGSNAVGMCSTCYGPFYVQQHDPKHVKLQSRIERRYMLQLTKGCGYDWCENEECCSGKAPKMGVKDAIERIRTKLLPTIGNMPISGNEQDTKVWFCVNESIQRRKRVVDAIMAEHEYDEALIYRAANEARDDGIREWLVEHAVKNRA